MDLMMYIDYEICVWVFGIKGFGFLSLYVIVKIVEGGNVFNYDNELMRSIKCMF